MPVNIYKEILKSNLPRLFNNFNLDAGSQAYGFGDRLHWGWKISDFSNGTMQGGVHALAIAIKLEILENEAFVLKLIDAAICAIDRIRARNGSMVEAYPGESSFCVTALVAFDVLSAIRHLGDRIHGEKRNKYLNVIRPLIGFIVKNNEEHAVISNHLATAVAAVTLWNLLTGDNLSRGNELLNIIFENQSEEGWYREYEGADPGYQTLCTYYLACVYEVTRDESLLRSLEKSGNYLKYFVHPDGSLGGLYGSRNTEVYYPGGAVILAGSVKIFAEIAGFMQGATTIENHMMPNDIDSGNYTPLLNSYAAAALHYDTNCLFFDENYEPEFSRQFKKNFKDSGVYLCSTGSYYAVVNYKKGGALKVYNKKNNNIDIEDGGLSGRLKNKKAFTTQIFDDEINFENKTIESSFYLSNESYPDPVTLIILRLLSLTLFKSVFLGNIFKKMIVKMLMTGKKRIDGKVIRNFTFSENEIIVSECIECPKDAEYIDHMGKSTSIHMASSGYHLPPMERLSLKSQIVNFRKTIV